MDKNYNDYDDHQQQKVTFHWFFLICIFHNETLVLGRDHAFP